MDSWIPVNFQFIQLSVVQDILNYIYCCILCYLLLQCIPNNLLLHSSWFFAAFLFIIYRLIVHDLSLHSLLMITAFYIIYCYIGYDFCCVLCYLLLHSIFLLVRSLFFIAAFSILIPKFSITYCCIYNYILLQSLWLIAILSIVYLYSLFLLHSL